MEAHVETLKASKGLAAVAWRALSDAEFLRDAKRTFEGQEKLL
jgi:hypothetical protein